MDWYTGFQTVTKPMRAVVVGGGFIGLEMVESLAHLGLEVTLVERAEPGDAAARSRRWRGWSNATW